MFKHEHPFRDTQQNACCVYLTPEDWQSGGRRGAPRDSPYPHFFCVCQSALGGNQSLRLHLCFSVKAKFGSSASKKN